MRKKGLEPLPPFGHQLLRLARRASVRHGLLRGIVDVNEFAGVESATQSKQMLRTPAPAPSPGQFWAAGVVLLVFVMYVGYRIYSSILNQMAKNAKNKRIIKNEVTQWTGREYRRSRRR